MYYLSMYSKREIYNYTGLSIDVNIFDKTDLFNFVKKNINSIKFTKFEWNHYMFYKNI